MNNNTPENQPNDSVAHDADRPRAGQSAFNALWAWRPDIARLVTGTDADPYYNDEQLPAFFHRVTELLAAEPGEDTNPPAETLRRYAEGATHRPPSRKQVANILAELARAEKTTQLLGETLTEVIGEGRRHWPRENRLDGTAKLLEEAADAYQNWVEYNQQPGRR